jgi:hypothetical protein
MADIANPSDFPDVDVEQDQAQMRMEQQEKLQIFGASLAKKRDEWVRARASAGVDKRFKEDTDQYHGRDAANRTATSMMGSVEAGFPQQAVTTNRATRSTLFVGVTRQKVNAGEARLSDIVLPSDDRNFGIDPTPDPEMVKGMKNEEQAINPQTGQPMMGPDGQPLKMSAIAQAAHKAARVASDGMQDAIDDQLTECDFNGETRKMLHDCGLYGTGVMKGPVVVSRTRKSWSKQIDQTGQSTRVLELKETLKPASFRVDPRKCFPDPSCGDDIHDGSGHFEYDNMTAKRVRDLVKQPGYMKEQLAKVLDDKPKNSAAFDDLRDIDQRRDLKGDDTYEKWEYWGELDSEDLLAAGVDLGAGNGSDPLKSVSGVVEMIGDVVVRAYKNPLEDGALPYDYLPWEKVSDSPWGYGIAHLMRAQQQVTNASWRQLMDNAGISSGPQIVVKSSTIKPADGKWEIGPRKIWLASEETQDVRQAFTSIQFDSKQAELANILKMAEALADQETAVPDMVQGDKGGTQETVGGMQMRMNGSNVVLRRLVKQFDDFFMKPHIRRYYDFNMAYSEDESIKGDFDVNPRGSSALMIRDIQNQAFLGLLQMAANPVFAPMLDPKRLFEKALRAQHVDPTDIMRTDEEIAQAQQQQAQNQQPDPRIQAAQLRANADVEREKMRVQEGQMTAQTKMNIAQMTESSRMQELQVEREIAMLRLSADQNVSLDKIKAMLADTALRERTKKEITSATLEMQAHIHHNPKTVQGI